MKLALTLPAVCMSIQPLIEQIIHLYLARNIWEVYNPCAPAQLLSFKQKQAMACGPLRACWRAGINGLAQRYRLVQVALYCVSFGMLYRGADLERRLEKSAECNTHVQQTAIHVHRPISGERPSDLLV